MAKYCIDLETADKELLRVYDFLNGYNAHFYAGFMFARETLHNVPSADVVPVVHGRWDEEPVEFWNEPDYKCSICGVYAVTDSKGKQRCSKYCPNCGAKMDKE